MSNKLSDVVKELWQDILDKDDRNSPPEYPDMALLTFAEFQAAIRAVFDAIAEPQHATWVIINQLAQKLRNGDISEEGQYHGLIAALRNEVEGE